MNQLTLKPAQWLIALLVLTLPLQMGFTNPADPPPGEPQGLTPGTVPLFRLYNGTDHLYTANPEERVKAMEEYGYTTDEGVAGYVFPCQVDKSVPLYRLYNGVDHLYTTSEEERNKAMDEFGYTTDEGIAGYIFTREVRGSLPLYRLYNGKDHLYTASKEEVETAMEEYGYTTNEGIAGYIFK